MHKLVEFIDDELKELESKAKKDGALSRTEIEDGKNLAKFKMALLTNEAMENDGESGMLPYSGMRSNDDRVPYRRGVSNARRHDYRGRYSNDDARDGMISELREIMQDAPDDYTKKRFQSFIRELENA